MPLKSFGVSVLIRVLLILANTILLALIFGRGDLFFNQIILGSLLLIQVFYLIRYVNQTNRELAKLLLSLKNQDFTIHFPAQRKDQSFQELYQSFREIIDSYKSAKTEKEVQYQYLSMIVSHIKVGIISLKGENEIALLNQPGMEMLQITRFHYWSNLARACPEFVEAVQQVGDGDRKLIEVQVAGDHKKFSVFVKSVVLMGLPYKIITFQDIGQELDQGELEAWHKLIRILTHEIMNSVTPISSLTETLLMMAQHADGKVKTREELTDRFTVDLTYSLETIQRRSDNLLHFLDDYRKLTRVPLPQKTQFSVTTLFDNMERLMQGEISKRGISFHTDVAPDQLMILADYRQIEQILINLMTNSLQALEGITDPHISLSGFEQSGQAVIEIEDNGEGIDEEKLDQIFVPFFSTKEHGSGIGLSLSRHIMSLHGGNIRVSSRKYDYTIFSLFF